jgi:hypothetical protein
MATLPLTEDEKTMIYDLVKVNIIEWHYCQYPVVGVKNLQKYAHCISLCDLDDLCKCVSEDIIANIDGFIEDNIKIEDRHLCIQHLTDFDGICENFYGHSKAWYDLTDGHYNLSKYIKKIFIKRDLYEC